jgi:peptidoglycan/xylan/chitin deacetylase (PgdA/CDA1 family)
MAKAVKQIKDLVVGAFGGAVRTPLGAGAFDRMAKPRFQILVYHRVLAAPDPFAIAPVAADVFAAQMKLLRERYHPVSLDALLADAARGEVRPGSVCVTFDDGYLDNHDVALPILKANGIPATIYLATDFIGTGKLTWYDRVFQAFKASPRKEYSLPEAGAVGAAIGDPQARHRQAVRIQEWLKGFDPSARDACIQMLFAALGLDKEPEASLMLDWDRVRAMHSEGITFGAHTRSHPILSTLDAASAETELAGSKRDIEARLDSPVLHFAYPNGKKGDYTEETKALLRKAGYASAVTTNYGANPFGQDRFDLLRSQPWENSLNRFHGRMALERIA